MIIIIIIGKLVNLHVVENEILGWRQNTWKYVSVSLHMLPSPDSVQYFKLRPRANMTSINNSIKTTQAELGAFDWGPPKDPNIFKKALIKIETENSDMNSLGTHWYTVIKNWTIE